MTPRKSSGFTPDKSLSIKVPVKEQVSAGGVVFRGDKGSVEVVIVSVGGQNRWQLPKGLVDQAENPEIAGPLGSDRGCNEPACFRQRAPGDGESARANRLTSPAHRTGI